MHLFKSHAIMLEHQARVSMLLTKLGESLNHRTFHFVVQTCFRLMHQIHGYMVVEFKPKEKKKMTREDRIMKKITPDPKKMEEWAKGSGTLYLDATVYYYIQ